MFTESDWMALGLTLRLALVTTTILLLIGTPVAWWLARSRSKMRPVIEALVALPLVLPPTVLGFYLLIALGPQGIGDLFGGRSLAFSFTGLIIGSVIYSFPFVVQPIKNSFEQMGRRPIEVAATLRASPLDRFFSVVMPLSLPGFITAATLGFAHTMGEFGVVLMIGGNIPGETRVLSIAIYDYVEALNYGQAHLLSFSLFAMSFLLFLVVFLLNRKFRVPSP